MYLKSIKYIFPVKNTTYFDVVKHLDVPKHYNYYNPSGFIYNNKMYTTHRIHYGKFYSLPIRIMQILGKVRKSHIAISTEDNKVIDVKVPDVKDIEKFKKQTSFKKYRMAGYDDARALLIKNKLYLLANTCVNHNNYCQMCLLRFNIDKLESNILEFEDIILIEPSLNKTCHQKNWMPIVKDEKLYLIYSINPVKVYECNIETGHIDLICEHNPNKNLPSHIRGGSNVLEYYSKMFNENVYLCISHIRRKGYYTHLFVILSKDYKIKAISDEFMIDKQSLRFIEYSTIIHHINIQFVSSILIINDTLNVFYGNYDTTSHRFEIGLDLMEKSLKKIL